MYTAMSHLTDDSFVHSLKIDPPTTQFSVCVEFLLETVFFDKKGLLISTTLIDNFLCFQIETFLKFFTKRLNSKGKVIASLSH